MRTTTAPNEDHVPYSMAAKTLKCSRRTIERLVERGELNRAADAQIASVTLQSLSAAVERRNAALAQLPTTRQTPANDLEGAALLQLLDQLATANTERSEAERRATDLQLQLRQIEASAAERARLSDEREKLIDVLVNGSRRDRKAARRAAKATN